MVVIDWQICSITVRLRQLTIYVLDKVQNAFHIDSSMHITMTRRARFWMLSSKTVKILDKNET